MTPVRLGLAGLGRLAEVGYVPALRRLGDVVLSGVADVRPQRCALLAPGVPAWMTAEELVSEVELDLLVVATPPSAHVNDAAAAANAGVRALVEKPPAATFEEALVLDRLEPRPWIGLDRRFDPVVARLRESVVTATPPFEIDASMSILPSAWSPVTPPPGPLLDLGAHVIDLVQWVGGGAVTAVNRAHVSPSDASLELELANGQARVVLSHRRPWRESIVVRDARGRRNAYVRGGLPRRAALRALRRPSPLVTTLAAQLHAVGAATRAGPTDDRLATTQDAVALLGVIDAAERSAAAGAREQVAVAR